MSFWGRCEANYAVNRYVAEFYNTISSLFILALGVYGIAMHRAIRRATGRTMLMESRFWACFASLAVVGLGSAAFHGTLLVS